MDANRTSASGSLKSELARYCLPATNRDSNRKLAWVNSICILFLIIGLAGAGPASIPINAPPPLEQIVPAIIEPVVVPPTTVGAAQKQFSAAETKFDLPQVVVVTPDSPKINFSVPTIGNLVVPNQVAVAPPASPTKPVTPLKQVPLTLQQTGSGGNLPTPPYPVLAQQMHMEGTVVLWITVDEKGKILSIDFKQSAGPIFDRSCAEYVKQHWMFPSGPAGRVYEQPFNYTFTRKLN